MSNVKTELQRLEEELAYSKNTLSMFGMRITNIKRELVKAEDNYIAQREAVLKAEDAVETYKLTRVLTTVDEDLKAKEIKAFVGRLPGVRAIVDEQDRVRDAKEAQQQDERDMASFKAKVDKKVNE
jgi:hypothetical protein